MLTLQQKLSALLRKIKNNSYGTSELGQMVKLQKKIAEDIGCDDPAEAMALLGYLLKYEYVIINQERGIILNKDKNKDIDLLMEK